MYFKNKTKNKQKKLEREKNIVKKLKSSDSSIMAV